MGAPANIVSMLIDMASLVTEAQIEGFNEVHNHLIESKRLLITKFVLLGFSNNT